MTDYATGPFTDDQLAGFLAGAQAVIDQHYAASYPTQQPARLAVSRGEKWTRIVFDGAAWAFIGNDSGLICKPESWKRPAKGPRGTIHTPTFGVEFVTVDGPRYLRDMPRNS